MSWSAYTLALAADVTSRVGELAALRAGGSEQDEQVAAAKAAAQALVDSGALGSGEAFHIGISGHANPAHQLQTDGSPPDTITVAITQTTAEQVAAFDEMIAAQQMPAKAAREDRAANRQDPRARRLSA